VRETHDDRFQTVFVFAVQSIWVVMILSTLVFRQVTSALPGDENEFAEFEVRIYSNLRNISTKIQEFDDAPATPPVAPDPDPPLQTSKSPSPGGAQPQAPAHKPVDSDEDDENQAVVEVCNGFLLTEYC
jgi:hypothetical protein